MCFALFATLSSALLCFLHLRQLPLPRSPDKISRRLDYHCNQPSLRNLAGVGDALGFLHDNDIIHADVKPANILRDKNFSRFVLTDLGVAGGESYHVVDTCFFTEWWWLGWFAWSKCECEFSTISENVKIDTKRGNVLGDQSDSHCH